MREFDKSSNAKGVKTRKKKCCFKTNANEARVGMQGGVTSDIV